MRKALFCFIIFSLVHSVLPATGYAESVAIDTVEISGIDRSNIDLVNPGSLIKFTLSKEIEAERGGFVTPLPLGPFSVWSRFGLGNKNTYNFSFVTGLTLDEVVGDFQGSYLTGDWVRDGEEYTVGDASTSFTWIREDGFTLRLAGHFLSSRFVLLGPLDISSPATRTDTGVAVNIDAGYVFKDSTEVNFGIFFDSYEVERAWSTSEQRSGINLLLLHEDLSINMRMWALSFSHGQKEAYASVEIRDDKIVRTGDVSIGGIFGAHLVNSSRVFISPRITAGWDVHPRFRLNALIGYVHEQPTIADIVFSNPQIDPYIEIPDTTRMIIGEVSGYYAPNDFSSVQITLSYKDVRKAVYLERDASGYVQVYSLDDVTLYSAKIHVELRITDKLRAFGTYYYVYANLEGEKNHYPYLSKYQSFAGLQYEISDKWQIKMEAEFRGSVFTSLAGGDSTGGYTIINMELKYKVEAFFDFFIRANNLTNAGYYIFDGWRGQGSNVLFGVEVRF